MRLDALGEPDAGADDRVVADDGSPAEHRGAGVNDDAIFDRRVTLVAADELAVAVGREAEGAERNALVKFDVVADLGAFRRSPRRCRDR